MPALSLKDIFTREIQMSVASFKEKLSRLAVFAGADPLYLSPAATQAMAGMDYAFLHGCDDLSRRIKNGAAAAACTVRLESDGQHFYIMELNTHETALTDAPRGSVSKNFPALMDVLGTYDHEHGHHVVDGGIPRLSKNGKQIGINGAETAADAYRSLRHAQRFGTTTDFFSFAPGAAANLLIRFADTHHYTAAVISKIETLRGSMDLTALSLPETAQLAGSLAQRYRLNESTLKRICAVYAPVRKYETAHPGDMDGIRKKIFTTMKKNARDHDAYRAGKYLINAYLDGGLIDTADAFWQEAIAFMKCYEEKSGIVLNAAAALDMRKNSGNILKA